MLRFACACLLALSACTSPVTGEDGPFASEDDYRQRRDAAVAALDETIGTPRADDVSACQAVAVGEQACGGPTSFSVYSTLTAEPARVEAAAERVTSLDRSANAQFEYVSTCVLLSPPSLVIDGGVCVVAR